MLLIDPGGQYSPLFGSFCVILVQFGANDGQLDQAALAAWLGAKRRHKALRQELGGPGGGAAWFH